VRKEDAVVEKGRSDPGAEGRDDREAACVACCPVTNLGDSRGVGVVDEVDLAAESVLEELLSLEVEPFLRDVRRGEGLAVLHDRGEGDAERQPGVRDAESAQHLFDGGEHVVRRRAARGGDADPVRVKGAVLEIDDPCLDAGAADVHADRLCHALSLASGAASDSRK
ncbi:hypothetical protein ABE10_12405, partial [Bacillus toyonensis]|nr:hypothetical protein [Bacillus toyonensis]